MMGDWSKVPLVLIVEDEAPQAEVLQYNLDKAGYRTLVASTGEEALELIAAEQPDLVVLDWMLPHLSGLEVCRRLRSAQETRGLPIIMVSGRGDQDDRISGLDGGADDYVVKPFLPSEMVARVRAVLRRSRPSLGEDRMAYGDIYIDLVEHKVIRNGAPVHLGPTEYRLLTTLMERPGKVFSRENLLRIVWGQNIHVLERTVDVHIRRLRRALATHGESDIIRTVRGAGYSVDVENR